MAQAGEMPKRMIEGQATLLSRSVHNIRYDPIHDEIVAGNPVAQAVLVFRGGADGEEPPIRIIQGPRTMLWDPDHVDIDPVHNEIIVPEGDKILVFPREANGDVPPIRVIQGPDTRLGKARAIAIDPVNKLIIVSTDKVGGPASSEDMPDRAKGAILIFDRTANGNVKPRGVIPGFGAINDIVVSPKGWLLVPLGSRGWTAQGVGSEDQNRHSGIGIWSVHDTGNISPRWILGGPQTNLRGGGGGMGNIALNPQEKELIVYEDSGLAGYYLPEIF